MTPSDAPPPSSSPIQTAAPYLGEGAHIGVFDSGLGGLSVLRALRARLPRARFSYVADSGHAPYGERDESFVTGRSLAICDFLLTQDVNAVVVACNTATAAAVAALRQAHPALPIVGVEPGVKPAVARSARKRVGVLATPGTLGSAKFKDLLARHGAGANIVAQPCPGLALEIEAGQLDTPRLRAMVAQFCAPLRTQSVDTVVLGCTHYPLILPLFQAALGPDVVIIDTAQAVAEQAARICQAAHVGQPGDVQRPPADGTAPPPPLALWSSADAAHLGALAQRWLGLEAPARSLPAMPHGPQQ